MQMVGVEADEELEDEVELPMSGDYVHAPKFEKNTFTLPVTVSIKDSRSKILLAEVVTSLLNSIYLQDPIAKNLHNLHTRDENKKVFIETEGINMEAFWALPSECIDIEGIYTNDIGMILEKYGVEACRQSIVNEIRNVFNHYGIEVNYRHLFLISDYMTHHGGYRACNRQGMENAASPLLQMSYETSMKFCTTAGVEGLTDNLQSPTGSIVIGSAPQLGSNSFTVHSEIPQQQTTKKKVFEFC
jgi:DNA-directed RNA polymerase I subunit RPA1